MENHELVMKGPSLSQKQEKGKGGSNCHKPTTHIRAQSKRFLQSVEVQQAIVAVICKCVFPATQEGWKREEKGKEKKEEGKGKRKKERK